MQPLTPPLTPGLDFHFYWAAAKALLDGSSPYDHGAFEAAVLASGFPAGYDIPWYPYLPTSLLWFLPFRYLQFQPALLLWFLILAAATAVIFRLSFELIGAKRTAWCSVSALALLAAFPPLLRALLLGQAAIPVAALIIAALTCLTKNRPGLAGALLAVAVAKPQSFAVILPLLIVSSIRTGTTRFLWGFLGALLAQGAIITVIRPTIWTEFAAFAFATAGKLTEVSNHSPAAILAGITSTHIFFILPAAGAIAGAFAGGKKQTLFSLLGFWIPLSLLCAPYGWVHESLILFPAAAAFSIVIGERNRSWGEWILPILFVPILFLIPGSRIETVAWIFPAATLAAFRMFERRLFQSPAIDLSFPPFLKRSLQKPGRDVSV